MQGKCERGRGGPGIPAVGIWRREGRKKKVAGRSALWKEKITIQHPSDEGVNLAQGKKSVRMTREVGWETLSSLFSGLKEKRSGGRAGQSYAGGGPPKDSLEEGEGVYT